MNSETVYQVAKALPMEEQILLFEKLKNDFMVVNNNSKNRKKLLTKDVATNYLLTHIFNKNVENF